MVVCMPSWYRVMHQSLDASQGIRGRHLVSPPYPPPPRRHMDTHFNAARRNGGKSGACGAGAGVARVTSDGWRAVWRENGGAAYGTWGPSSRKAGL